MKVLVSALFVVVAMAVGSSARADEKTFDLVLTVNAKDTGVVLGKAECMVRQQLDRSDIGAIFRCAFNDGRPKMGLFEATEFGREFEDLYVPYVSYDLSSDYRLGKFLYGGMGVAGVKKGPTLKILLHSLQPKARDTVMPLETANADLELRVTELRYY